MNVKEILKFLSGTLVIFGYTLIARVYGCDEESVYDALQACQEQREDLSTASGTSFSGNEANYTQLCRAFRSYVDCMDPRIGNCNGTATSAFKIIKDTYSAEPYGCTPKDVKIQPKTETPSKPTEEIINDIPTKTTKQNTPVKKIDVDSSSIQLVSNFSYFLSSLFIGVLLL